MAYINGKDDFMVVLNSGDGEGGFSDVELPQEWFDINNAYEEAGVSDHKLIGGLFFKDFEGNIKVFPLSPPYGVRTDECGAKISAVAVYNSAQQLLVKPATDGRHTVSLRQLDEFFGGGNTSDLEKGEKAFSIRKVPPVDTSIEDVNYRMPYVFCRDTENIFSAKFYNEQPLPNTLVERSPSGSIACIDPTSEANPVTLGYANKKLLSKSGGVLSGKLTSKTANPYFSLIDTQDNSSQSYVQAYRGKTYMGYSVAKSISVDKEGNAGVVGGLTVGGSISCGEPKEDTDAVTLGYLESRLQALLEEIAKQST